MIHDHHPDPSHEAISEAARLAAVLVTATEAVVLMATKDPPRSRQQRRHDGQVLEDTMAGDRRNPTSAAPAATVNRIVPRKPALPRMAINDDRGARTAAPAHRRQPTASPRRR